MPTHRDDSSGNFEVCGPLLSARTAREAAFIAIEEFRNSGTWLSDVLDRIFRSASLPPIERGLATELACGVVRRQETLDAILSQLVSRRIGNVEPSLLTILRLGIYQLALLDGIPSHAAVHETVELTRRLGRHQWTGFVNGVLRGGTRIVTQVFDKEPSAFGVPVGVARYRRREAPVFADPKFNLCGYFADAFSFPDWLVERWAARLIPSDLFRLGLWFNTPGKLTLRVNRLRTAPDSLVNEFQVAGIAGQRIAGSDSIQLHDSCSVEALPGYTDGRFAVQDLSASRAALRLAPRPGQRVWDLCAAPGGKTCHLAELMQNEGEIIATDIRPDRLALIEENRSRLGADIIRTRLIGHDLSNIPEGLFDAVLVDVPCSNTGVLGKRPEARWRINEAEITELSGIQARLLTAGLGSLAVNGRLVYSTCSIESEENEQLVRRVLAGRADVQLIEEEHFFPGQPTDGGYQALLVRTHSESSANLVAEIGCLTAS